MAKTIRKQQRGKAVARSELLESLERGFRDMSAAGVMLHQTVADHLGLHLTDHKCMGLLCERGPLSAGDLAKLTGLTTGAITGVLNRLERSGYARRVPNPKDRRNIRVEPQNVAKFEQRMKSLLGSLRERMRALSSKYGSDELAVVLDFMNASVAISRDETARLRDEVSETTSRPSRKNS